MQNLREGGKVDSPLGNSLGRKRDKMKGKTIETERAKRKISPPLAIQGY